MSSPPPASVPVALGLGLGGVASSQVGKPPPSPPNHHLQIPSHSFITPPPPSMGSLFTFMQLQELQQQALIYKYMSSGLPVPLHLVLPIWKSLASSAYQHHQVHPAVMMGFKFDVGLLGGFDYKNLLEPEPNRCRRTDGKKWRCARDVVPDHKYCDKHLHRGRNRSRKHVEQQQEAAAAVTAAASAVATRDGASNVATLAAAAGSDATAALPNNDSSVLSVPPPTSLQLMPPASHCPTTINSSVPVYGGGINSLAALRSYATTNTNSNANNVANLFNSASPPQMFGFSPTSVLLGDRTTTGVSYF